MSNNNEIFYLLFPIMGLAIWLYVKLKAERKNSEKLSSENARLIANNAMLEADQLKYQLQPHTLNNILANLKVFSNKLSLGMDSLSDTLDYILYKGNMNLVSVKDELAFIDKYLKLNDLFINEIDSVTYDTSKVDISSKYFEEACIPHLITAHFIENAFKHGDINHPNFLDIKVLLSNNSFELFITNKVKLKTQKKAGGLGLNNMHKRLELLQIGTFKIEHGGTESDYYSKLNIEFPK